ncbi:recombinase family protein [Oscillospiraceae bacterium PP1C4]
MINAVGYCRFSSNNQREESIDAQKRAIKYFAQQEGYNILRFYEDKAISGKTDNRPSFQQMIEDVKKGEFQAVIVHKLDRFSRDIADSMQYEKLLRQSDVELVSVMEKLDSTPTGKLMKVIISGINSFYVDNLAIEVFKGLKENAYKAQATGGKAPLGYDIVDKKYVINEKEADAIRLLFQMYDQGHGYGAIIRQLNALGYKTKANKPFGKNSIYELLHNEKYKGVFVYNKHTSRRPDGTRTRTTKPDSEIIRIPNGIPAIVSEELWNRCNERLKNNKRNAGSFKAKEMYLLSGLIYCGECGYAMHGNARYPAPDRPKLVTYRCSHRDNNLSCNNKEIKRDDVENFVIDQLQKYMFNDEIIPKLTKNLNEYITQNTVTNDTDKVKYVKKLKELETSKSNIIDAITKTGFADVFTQKLADIESEMATVSVMLKRLEKSKPVSEITEDMVQQYLGSFKHFILKRDKPQIKKFIDSYVERVDVFKDKVKVTFKISLGVNQLKNVEYSFEKNTSRKELKSA